MKTRISDSQENAEQTAPGRPLDAQALVGQPPLIDRFGREITYLRLSVTDRCDLRCAYCMTEKMTFLPKKEVLSIEELEAIANAFIDRGVRKIRITGGEPLVRRDIMTLLARLGTHLDAGSLDELTLTTNATQLYHYADVLRAIGVKRINVSLDTLDDEKFKKITRRDVLSKTLNGIDAAQQAGLDVKINTVALKGVNDTEIPAMIEWAHGRNMALTMIEIMPLGQIEEDRADQFLPLSIIRDALEARWTLEPIAKRTGGPARYVRVTETGGEVGFITPLTENFCGGCNRMRVTCTGQLYTCLGHGGMIDLRAAVRGRDPDEAIRKALDTAMMTKPERHDFEGANRAARPAVARHMSVTGG